SGILLTSPCQGIPKDHIATRPSPPSLSNPASNFLVFPQNSSITGISVTAIIILLVLSHTTRTIGPSSRSVPATKTVVPFNGGWRCQGQTQTVIRYWNLAKSRDPDDTVESE
uniref:Uncharacterized protein n=1 Tax=Anopheles atroparvus TaxID=41427 RepID=A0AAG5D852_ANOAO